MLQTQGGQSAALAHRNAFLALLGMQLAAYAWFWLAGRPPSDGYLCPKPQKAKN
jgi:hypothetical protein